MLETVRHYVRLSGVTVAVVGLTVAWFIFLGKRNRNPEGGSEPELNFIATNKPLDRKRTIRRKVGKEKEEQKFKKLKIYYATQTGTAKVLIKNLTITNCDSAINWSLYKVNIYAGICFCIS